MGAPVIETVEDLRRLIVKPGAKSVEERLAARAAILEFGMDHNLLYTLTRELLDSNREPQRLSEFRPEDIWEAGEIWEWAVPDPNACDNELGPFATYDLTATVLVQSYRYQPLPTQDGPVDLRICLSTSGTWYVIQRTGKHVRVVAATWHDTHALLENIKLLTLEQPLLPTAEPGPELPFTPDEVLLDLYCALVAIEARTDEEQRAKLEQGEVMTAMHHLIKSTFTS